MKTERQADMNHPSFLALDRAHLGLASPEVHAHTQACDACRQYVESLNEPGFAPNFETMRRAFDASPRRSRWRWVFASVSLAAAACGVFLFVAQREPSAPRADDTYVGAKGFRSVWIYIRRGAETQLWDGKKPVAPGDRVRMKIDAGKYHRVEVYSLSDPQHPTSLFQGSLVPGQNLTLPDAWEIDDSPTAEQLFVVFSDMPVSPQWDEWRGGKVPPGVAVLPFVLPKSGLMAADAGSSNP